MFAVAVLRPTQPRGDSLFVGFRVKRRLPFVELGGGTAEILFYALPDELLFPVKLITDIIKPTTVPVIAVHGDRKDLPVVLDFQFKFLFEIGLDKLVKEPAQRFLAFAVKGEVVGVFLAVYFLHFIYLVHEVTEKQVSEVLRQVVSNRHTVCAVDDFIKQPQQVFVLYLASDDAFQHVVLYGRIVFLYVDFKAVHGLSPVFAYHLIDVPGTALYTPSLDAGVGVIRECLYPYRLQYVHNGVVDYAVGIVRKTINDTLFRFVYGKYFVRRCPECLCQQSLVESLYVGFPVTVVNPDTV